MLEFLSVAGPGAVSPIFDIVRDDAVAGDRAGWCVAAQIGTQEQERHALATTVGWGDLCHLRKRRCRSGEISLEAGEGLDVTTQWGAIGIAGPLARETIARFCALDLRPGRVSPDTQLPGSIARTPGTVMVVDASRFVLLFGWALSEYLWTVVSVAGARLGGRPVGSEALELELGIAEASRA